MSAERRVVDFLGKYQDIWQLHFPNMHRRAQWHVVCFLCTRKRNGVAVAEISGWIRQLLLLDEATVRERLNDLQADGLCSLDPSGRSISARTIVMPAPSLLVAFDNHLRDMIRSLIATFRPGGSAPEFDGDIDSATRQMMIDLLERCDTLWIGAFEAVFDTGNLAGSYRVEARRRLLSLPFRMLMDLATAYRYGDTSLADGGDGLLADAMASALLGRTKQNFQTTRDHIGYLMRISLLDRRPGRNLRVALPDNVAMSLHRALGQMELELAQVAGKLVRQDEFLATTIPLNAVSESAKPAYTLIVSRAGGEVARYDLGPEPLTIGRSPTCSVVLDDSAISRKHCSVSFDEDGLWVTDHKSTNGTFRDGERLVGTQSLLPDTPLTVGSFVLICHQN